MEIFTQQSKKKGDPTKARKVVHSMTILGFIPYIGYFKQTADVCHVIFFHFVINSIIAAWRKLQKLVSMKVR